MGILTPCAAKFLLSWVLSLTPGNFFADQTVKGSENVSARMGQAPVFSVPVAAPPTLTKDSLRLDMTEVSQGAMRKPGVYFQEVSV